MQDNMDRSLRELQGLSSDLHKVILIKASLPIVKLAYKLDPNSLTDEVLTDAFQSGARQDVLQFLVEKKGLDQNQRSELIAKTCLSAIPVLQSGNHREREEQLAIINGLIQAFPNDLTNGDGNNPFCPFNIVLYSTCFPHLILESMANYVRKSMPAFSLRGDDRLPLENPHFLRVFRPSLCGRCMKCIGAILTSVEDFSSHHWRFTEQEFSTLLAMLMRASNSAKKVHLNINMGQFNRSMEELIGPAKAQLEHGGECNIEEFSFSYAASLGVANRRPDFALHALHFYMKNLKRLDITIAPPLRANQELCDILCGLLRKGQLECLSLDGGTDGNGLYLPLIQAVNDSQTLTDLRMQNLQSHSDVNKYQAEVLKVLDGNTRLVVALVCEDFVTQNVVFECTNRAMRTHVNKECFLDGTKGNPNQRQIDHLTMLNLVGRNEAKDEATLLEDFINLVSCKSLQQQIAFLEFEGQAEQDLITDLQYGLLREQPSLWVSKGSQFSVCHRKRKAIGPPEEC
jgi:hypothetical protein